MAPPSAPPSVYLHAERLLILPFFSASKNLVPASDSILSSSSDSIDRSAARSGRRRIPMADNERLATPSAPAEDDVEVDADGTTFRDIHPSPAVATTTTTYNWPASGSTSQCWWTTTHLLSCWKAEEKRALAEATLGTKTAKVMELAHFMKDVGRVLTKRSFFSFSSSS